MQLQHHHTRENTSKIQRDSNSRRPKRELLKKVWQANFFRHFAPADLLSRSASSCTSSAACACARRACGLCRRSFQQPPPSCLISSAAPATLAAAGLGLSGLKFCGGGFLCLLNSSRLLGAARVSLLLVSAVSLHSARGAPVAWSSSFCSSSAAPLASGWRVAWRFVFVVVDVAEKKLRLFLREPGKACFGHNHGPADQSDAYRRRGSP